MYIFKPSPLKSTLLQNRKLDEVQGALENDDDVFSPWNFEDKLMSNAIKAGNTGRMKKLLKRLWGAKISTFSCWEGQIVQEVVSEGMRRV